MSGVIHKKVGPFDCRMRLPARSRSGGGRDFGLLIAEFKTKKSMEHSVNNKPLVGASRNRWLRSRRHGITPKFRFLLTEPGAKAISSRLGQELG